MHDHEWLAERFDESRGHLKAVAYRMLGSAAEADDAVQEAWLKISRADTSQVQNFGAWLTTVVARVCLDILRSRTSRREEPLADMTAPFERSPDADVAMADAIGPALLVVLEMLAPAERVAFVLHDMFDLSFDEIAPIVGRTPAASRQLASRARRRVRGVGAPAAADAARRREVVGAFLAASRDGDFDRLLATLAPDVVLRADDEAVRTAAARQQQGAPALAAEIRGAALVAEAFKGRARAAASALIDGEPGAVWTSGGQVRAAFVMTVDDGRISGIEIVMDPARLGELEVTVG
jgi:RNA polymerase sigma-70 factor (ECF subfamily)